MNYQLSQHARQALAEREIPVEWMELVLNAPERSEPDDDDPALEHRLGRIAENENRVLRVIINSIANPIRIVTVYFDRSMRNTL